MNTKQTACTAANWMSLFDESQEAHAEYEAVIRRKNIYLGILYNQIKDNESTENVMIWLANIERDEAAAFLEWQNRINVFQDALNVRRNGVAA